MINVIRKRGTDKYINLVSNQASNCKDYTLVDLENATITSTARESFMVIEFLGIEKDDYCVEFYQDKTMFKVVVDLEKELGHKYIP